MLLSPVSASLAPCGAIWSSDDSRWPQVPECQGGALAESLQRPVCFPPQDGLLWKVPVEQSSRSGDDWEEGVIPVGQPRGSALQ